MPAPLDCPGIESWRALFNGSLLPDERERAERHLESCEVCQGRLDRAEECGDPLLQLGREVGDPTLAPADPTLTHVLDRLHEVKSTPRAAASEPVDLFFLRPSDRPDSMGTLWHYEVTEVIGQGGMGVVLKAFDPALHRLVAIKVMAPNIAGSATSRRRFKREAQAAAAVCHDHVVTVHGVDEADGLPYLVMQYVPGESLQTRLDRAGPLELVEIVRIGLQTALGLGAAHAQGLIHRDIKPANLLLENGLAKVKITDFGLARMSDDVTLTQNGVVAGTPEYMAPEQARGEPVDYRADLFSLGSVLYAMCTGVPPFRGPSTVAVLRWVSDHTPISIRELNPDIPDWLNEVILRLMAKDPARRFQNAAEVAGLLESYLAHLRQPKMVAAPELPDSPLVDNRDPPLPRRKNSLRKRVSLGVGLVSVLMFVGLVAAFFLVGREKDAGPRQFQEHHLSLKGAAADNPGIELIGPDNQQCVHFEPEGLRITLPAGYSDPERQNTKRPDTGISVPLAVKGDFEITVEYEIFKEPDRADAGFPHTRLTLDVSVDRESHVEATISRRVSKWGGTEFLTWVRRNEDGQDKSEYKGFSSQAKSGSLRLVRTGSTVVYYAAEGHDDHYTFLEQYPFSPDPVESIRVVASTGGPKAALDVRFANLHIRAESLNIASEVAALPVSGKGSPAIVLAFVLLSIAVLATFLAVWYRRRARPATAPAAPIESEEAVRDSTRFSFPCVHCGRKLRAGPELSGKHVKCPACGKAVQVRAFS